MKTANIPLLILTVLLAGLFVSAQGPQGDHPPPRPHDEARSGTDGPPGHGWRGEHGPPMTDEETHDAIEVLRKIDPDKAAQLDKLFSEDPQRVARVLHESFPKMGRFLMMKRHDPAGFDLWVQELRFNHDAMASAKRLRQAQDQQDDILIASEEITLRQIVSDHFDVRQKIREHQLSKLEQRIEEMREQLNERASDRDELIDQRFDELIDEDVGDRW